MSNYEVNTVHDWHKHFSVKNTAGFKFLAQSSPVVSPYLIHTVNSAPGKSQHNYN